MSVRRSLSRRRPVVLSMARVSQQLLAETVGTTRSRVNLFMNKFRSSGSSTKAIDFARSGRGGAFFMFQSRLISGGPFVYLWTAAREPFPVRYAMRQLIRTTRDRAVVLPVQPCDDGLHMYGAFLSYHGLAVMAVSAAWDALTAAPG